MAKKIDLNKYFEAYRNMISEKMIEKVLEVKKAYPQINSRMSIPEIIRLIKKD